MRQPPSGDLVCASCQQRWPWPVGVSVVQQQASETGHVAFTTDWEVGAMRMTQCVGTAQDQERRDAH